MDCSCFRGWHVMRSAGRGANCRDIRQIRQELAAARAVVADLEQTLDHAIAEGIATSEAYAHPALVESALSDKSKKPVTVFVDGAFDLMHFGHANAFRQARLLGDRLIVGVNSDASISECKGPPVMMDSERQAAVAACRFVDEIIPCSPYVMTDEYIEQLVKERGVDLFVHGDDPCIVNGRDVYAAAKAAGRYKSIPRTEGVSTTDIVGRALLLTREHHVLSDASSGRASPTKKLASAGQMSPPISLSSKSLVTSNLYGLFMASLPQQKKTNAKVVYIDGAWDMFHAGHIATLQKAHELGDWLIAGVHSDAVVNEHRGGNFPIMNMQERTLNLLSCRYVDDILMDAPWMVTRELIMSLNVSVVVRGTAHDTGIGPEDASDAQDPHGLPCELGISTTVQSDIPLTVEAIVDRIQQNREMLAKRHAKKSQSESEWYEQKHGLR